MSTPPSRDLYAVLGLTPNAAQGQITRAYHARLRQHHPDTRAEGEPVSDAALQDVLAAYVVLRDPARRAAYDQATHPPSCAPPKSSPRVILTHLRSARPSPAPIRAGPVWWRPK